ncbi:cupin domain-containing protein [Sphingosinithalassobacter portus]|uniref:cupin domain-containing protein n=1 Tax=Stakelama portus TaxID=2676234 RepID=UPI000D6E4422|nr:cupin domain-containing protein [Sphingosinithalassobacter portus]
MTRRRILVGAGGLALLCAATAVAQIAAGPELRLTPEEIAQMPAVQPSAGTSGIAAIRMVVLYGDPERAGPYTIALEVPPNTRIKAHTHRDERTAVVVRGTWYFGYGAHADDAAFKALGPGSFYTEPAGAAHFARTGADGATVYISGMGPSDTHYLE